MTLELLAPILASIAAGVALWWHENTNPRWRKIFFTATIIAGFVLTAIVIYRDQASKAEAQRTEELRRRENQKQNEEQRKMLLKIQAGRGDEEAIGELFKTNSALIEQLAASNNKDFLDTVSRAADATAEARRVLSMENSRAEAQAKVKWGPVETYIFASFDGKIKTLEEAHYVASVETEPVTLISENPNAFKVIRRATFAQGTQLSVTQRPLTVRGGRVDGEYMLNFSVSANKGFAGQENVLLIYIRENGLFATPGSGQNAELVSTSPNPIEDKEAFSKLDALISKMLTEIALKEKDKASATSPAK